MRKRILTDKERHIIETYLKTGEKLENFKVLLHRCRNLDKTEVDEDLKLVKELLKKWNDGKKST
jgi:hypothetical protein